MRCPAMPQLQHNCTKKKEHKHVWCTHAACVWCVYLCCGILAANRLACIEYTAECDKRNWIGSKWPRPSFLARTSKVIMAFIGRIRHISINWPCGQYKYCGMKNTKQKNKIRECRKIKTSRAKYALSVRGSRRVGSATSQFYWVNHRHTRFLHRMKQI